MTQKIIVQDGNVVYTTPDPDTQNINFTIKGQINITGAVNVDGSSGDSGQVLTSQGPDSPAIWGPGGGGGSTTLANTQVAFGSVSNTITSSANLVYDPSSNILSVGTTTDGLMTSTPGGSITIAADTSISLRADAREVVTINPDGSLNINGPIILNGTNGDPGQVLTSQGYGSPTIWSSVSNSIPAVLAPGDMLYANTTTTLTTVSKPATRAMLVMDNSGIPSWELPTIPQNLQAADYTLVLSDSGKHIFHPGTDGPSRTYTIPANASVAFPIGTVVTFVNQNGAGTVFIAITNDVMRLAVSGSTGTRTLAANGVATALKIASTEWIISGTGLS
jgi:hypothetical protein